MNQQQQQVIARVQELIAPLLKSRQLELVDLGYRQEGRQLFLKFLVDTVQGVKLNELSHLNQAIGAVLEEHEVIPGPYTLEVSSPGLDRPLKTPVDFERMVGRRLRVITLVPVEARTEHTGELINAGEEAIVLRLDTGQKCKISLSEIARATQEIDI